MTELEAIREAIKLQHEFVSTRKLLDVDDTGKVDLSRIKESIRWEYRANKQYPNRCTEGCKRELHGKAILLGKIARIIGKKS